MLLTEITIEIKKAGFVPYVKEDDGVKFMFMVSSNAKFGGSKPMISKGHIDAGESIKQAAIREAEEELGLIKSNIRKKTLIEAWRGEVKGEKQKYGMVIFAAEMKEKDAFTLPGKETSHTVWMTLQEFLKHGRTAHHQIMADISKKIS